MNRSNLWRIAGIAAVVCTAACIPVFFVSTLGIIWSTAHSTFWMRCLCTSIAVGVPSVAAAHLIAEFAE